ncbi:MAG: tetratricopeptide repeat protein [Chthoniobacterales bacterium]
MQNSILNTNLPSMLSSEEIEVITKKIEKFIHGGPLEELHENHEASERMKQSVKKSLNVSTILKKQAGKIEGSKTTEKESSTTVKAETILSAIYKTMKEGKPRYLAYGLTEEHMDSLFKSACNLYVEKNYSEAMDLFEQLATFNQRDPRGAMGIGLCFQKLEKYDAAAVFFLRSAEIEPKAKTLFSAVDCFVPLKNYPEAIKTLDKIISLSQEIPHGNDVRKEAEEARMSLMQLA